MKERNERKATVSHLKTTIRARRHATAACDINNVESITMQYTVLASDALEEVLKPAVNSVWILFLVAVFPNAVLSGLYVEMCISVHRTE